MLQGAWHFRVLGALGRRSPLGEGPDQRHLGTGAQAGKAGTAVQVGKVGGILVARLRNTVR